MTMIPDFTKIALDTASRAGASGAAPATKPIWDTPEGIAVKPVYTAADTAGLDTMTGIAPFLRGPYPRAMPKAHGPMIRLRRVRAGPSV